MPNPLNPKPKRDLFQNTGNGGKLDGDQQQQPVEPMKEERVSPTTEKLAPQGMLELQVPVVPPPPPPREQPAAPPSPSSPSLAPDEEHNKQVPPQEPRALSPGAQPGPRLDLPYGARVRRKNYWEDTSYNDFYARRSYGIDKRIAKQWDDLVSRSGHTKTDAFSRLALRLLLEAGYLIDPNILTKPVFKLEEIDYRQDEE